MCSVIKLTVARAVFQIYPFRALPRSKTLFYDWPPGKMLRRRLFGFDYFCDVSRDGPQGLLYLLGERYNISEAQLVKSLLRPGMRVADVGANIGYYTLSRSEWASIRHRAVAGKSAGTPNEH
jgi:hypothetical protein